MSGTLYARNWHQSEFLGSMATATVRGCYRQAFPCLLPMDSLPIEVKLLCLVWWPHFDAFGRPLFSGKPLSDGFGVANPGKPDKTLFLPVLQACQSCPWKCSNAHFGHSKTGPLLSFVIQGCNISVATIHLMFWRHHPCLLFISPS